MNVFIKEYDISSLFLEIDEVVDTACIADGTMEAFVHDNVPFPSSMGSRVDGSWVSFSYLGRLLDR